MTSVCSGHAAIYIDAAEPTLEVSTKQYKTEVPINSIFYQNANKGLSRVGEEFQFNTYNVRNRRPCPGDECVVSLGRHLNYAAFF